MHGRRVEPEQPHGLVALVGGDRRSSRPRARAASPMRSAHQRACGPWPTPGSLARDRVEHLELGAVQVRHDRDVRHDRRGRLVDRREVVQVEDPRAPQLGRSGDQPRPGRDHALALLRRHSRERPVGGALALLVGGVHRERRIHRILAAPPARHRVVVGGGHRVDAGEERRRVAERALGAQRSARERHVPPLSDERAREVPGDQRRSAAGIEQQAHRHRVTVACQARQRSPCRPGATVALRPAQPRSSSSSSRSARRRSRAMRAIDRSSWCTSGSDGSGRKT